MRMRTVDDWKLALRAALRDAMRAKNADAVAVLRETLAAIDNAEAPELDHAPPARSDVIAGATHGLGTGDIARRQLAPAEVTAIVARERQERLDAAASYASLGRDADAAVLRRQADVLHALLRPAAHDVAPRGG